VSAWGPGGAGGDSAYSPTLGFLKKIMIEEKTAYGDKKYTIYEMKNAVFWDDAVWLL
jgi:hypothetical protein